MNWILEHLQIVVMLAAAFAYWLKQTKDKAAEDRTDGPPPLNEPSAADEQVERTRRIQEEIRRKIAERRAGTARPTHPSAAPSERPVASSTLAPRPVVQSAGGTLRERMEAKMTEALKRIEDAAKAAAERERAREPAEERWEPARPTKVEIAAREAEKLAAERRAAVEALAERERERRAAATSASLTATLKEPESATVARGLRGDLRDPSSLRRAWLLREVLGTPVGLR